MQVFVKAPTGQSITLTVEASDTIAYVKAKLEAKAGCPANRLRLSFGGEAARERPHALELQHPEGEHLAAVHQLMGCARSPGGPPREDLRCC